MNTSQLTESLTKFFHADGHRIVFWHDPDQEFVDVVTDLGIEGVETVTLQTESLLELKVKLELEDREGKYLLYSTGPEPEPEKDWLLDIRLYSKTFHADRASILLGELGLVNQSMRSYLNERKKFFGSKDRIERLKKLVIPEDREKELDRKMLAVLTKADQPGTFDVLMKLFGEMCEGQECDYKSSPPTWDEIEKFGLAPFFWEQMTRTFGYAEPSPSLSDLLIRLLVNDLAITAKGRLPNSYKHFLLPDESRVLSANMSVFTAQWRSHLGHYKKYFLLSDAIAKDLRVKEHLGSFSHEDLIDAMTFEACERQVIRSIRDVLTSGKLDKPEEIKPVIQRRKDGYWATIQLDGYGSGVNVYSAVYDALNATVDLLILRKTHDLGFSFPSADRMFSSYVSDIYRFDQLYRLFHESSDRAELAGWDILKEVQQVVESCYNHWFLDQLAASWGGFLGGEAGLLKNWHISKVQNQRDFFLNFALPILNANARSKVFVVISDALRYEIAEELTKDINAKNRYKATLQPMLGVLPSYTSLGMAALLPHRKYGYKENAEQLLVDNQPCASLDQRSSILSNHDGIAVKADDLTAMNKDLGRELVRQCRVVYIYHNQIDATGDAATTEGNTFTAARKTIDELASLVRFIVNSLNGTNVLITADHGFLYQDSPPTPLEKSELPHKPDGVIKAKKRYVIGQGLGDSDKAWHGSTKSTAGTDTDMEFWVPKGVNRFHFSGGSRFIHGGAMLQEIVIPVIQVRELDGNSAKKTAVKQVGLSLLGSNRKIVNYIQKFEFIQTEKVSERMQPRTVVISIRDGDALISNEETVTFDSTSDSMEERKRTVKLMLKKGSYDNKRDYSLTIRDPETTIECERIPMIIDLAFVNDF